MTTIVAYHALIDQGRYREAEEVLTQAISSDPNDQNAYRLLCSLLRNLGRFAEAVGIAEEMHALWPESAYPFFLITSCKKILPTDRGLVEHAADLARSGACTDQDAALLHYALGKAFDELEEYDAAIEHFDVANLLCDRARSGRPFDRDALASSFEMAKAAFRRETFERGRGLGSESDKPVFVVGMIRSGTTLVEQILTSHPDIGSIGELPFWFSQPAQNARAEAAKNQLAKFAAGSLTAHYLKLLEVATPGKMRILDKMPNNYIVLGLIHLLFPKAKIIHCRRNPIDNCLSIYMTPYADPPRFAYSRNNIVAAYKLYANLMAHWRSAIPEDRFMDVDYEVLIADKEIAIRRMVEFCGAEWNDSCLRHEENERLVRTPSVWQVRQPIYSSSVGRWKNYETWLGPFSELL